MATPADRDLVANHVEIEVPPQTLDGVTLNPQFLRVKFDPCRKGKGRKEVLWVELSAANLEYLRMGVVNMGEHEGCDASRKWHAGKYSKMRTRRSSNGKRRRLQSSDNHESDEDDEELSNNSESTASLR